VTEYFNRFGKASDNKGYLQLRSRRRALCRAHQCVAVQPGGLGTLGGAARLGCGRFEGTIASTPVVVFAHMPLWTIYEPWVGNGRCGSVMSQLRRFGSVTVLNGHIHQIVQKVEGNRPFTRRADLLSAAGRRRGIGPGPSSAADQLAAMLGIPASRSRNTERIGAQ